MAAAHPGVPLVPPQPAPGVPDGCDSVPAARGRDGRSLLSSLRDSGAAGVRLWVSPRCACAAGGLAASREKPHRTLAGGISLRGEAPGQESKLEAGSLLCLFIFSCTESLICKRRAARWGGRREEAVVHAMPSSLPLPAGCWQLWSAWEVPQGRSW